METHLFMNSEITEVADNYKQILRNEIEDNSEEIIPDQLELKEIKLMPGVKFRSKSLHQKCVKIFKRNPTNIDISKPLILAVICRGKWLQEEEYIQNYAVLVKIKHKANINIYNRVKEKIDIRERIRIRP